MSKPPEFTETYRNWIIIRVPEAHRQSNGPPIDLYIAVHTRYFPALRKEAVQVVSGVDIPDLKADIDEAMKQ